MEEGKNETVAGGEDIDFLSLWRDIWDRKILVAAITFIGIAIGVTVALLQQPFYRAEAVISKVRDSGLSGAASIANQLGGLASVAGINLGPTGSTSDREAQSLLESRRLVEEFVKRENLAAELAKDAEGSPSQWQLVKMFREDILSIREDVRKGRVTVAIEWTDPAVAARWANGIIVLANELSRGRALDEGKRNIAYLKDQVERTDVVELRRVLYNLIENETKNLMLANARLEYSFMVIDSAVAPEVRIRPKRKAIVLIGLMFGFLSGAILAVLRNRLPKLKAAMGATHRAG